MRQLIRSLLTTFFSNFVAAGLISQLVCAEISRPDSRRLIPFATAKVSATQVSSADHSAAANTCYVATNGNDNQPGTAAAPWATLQHAVDAVSPGDTIIVRAGTYAGCKVRNSATANAPITLKAETRTRPLLNRPGPVNWHNSILEIENGGSLSYWVVDGFELANSPHHGIDIRLASFITVQNCYSHHNGTPTVRGDGIFLGFSDHPTLQSNETSYNSEHGIYHSNSADYPTIRGNLIHHNTNAGLHMNGDLSQGGDGILSFGLIEKNVIYENGTGGGSAINCDGVSDSIIRGSDKKVRLTD